jgi:hypothetical protein
MIQAECHSDDRKVEVEFDATTWFKQADDKEIIELAECGWGGDYPADEVAEFMSLKNKKVAEMFTYLRIRRDQGFECHVTEKDALRWILNNRPHLIRLSAE